MYNIAVIDDEWLSVKCVEKILGKYSDSKLRVMGITSATEALRTFREVKPDILFVDIRMPEMDGFELIDRVRAEINDQVQSIILSGYSELEFYKQALHSHVFDYILKPVKEVELLAVLDRAMSRYEKQTRTQQTLDVYKKAYVASVLNRFLDLEYAFILEHDKTRMETVLRQFEAMFCQPKFATLVIKFFGGKDSEGKLSAAEEHMARCFGDRVGHVAFSRHPDEIVALLNCADENYIVSCLPALLKRMDTGGPVMSAGLGCFCGRFGDLPQSYRQAEEALMNRYLDPTRPVFMAEKNPNPAADPVSASPAFVKALETLPELFYLSEDEIVKRIERLLGGFPFRSYADLANGCDEICAIYNRLVKENRLDVPLLNKEHILNTTGSLPGLTDIIIGHYRRAARQLQSKHSPRQRANVENSLRYISKNYRQNLSMGRIAETYEVGSSYYSILFKEITGQSFTQYLNLLRLSEAKSLLRQSEMKAKAIAEFIGFKDYYYFCKVFKKFTGQSPTEFRKASSCHGR